MGVKIWPPELSWQYRPTTTVTTLVPVTGFGRTICVVTSPGLDADAGAARPSGADDDSGAAASDRLVAESAVTCGTAVKDGDGIEATACGSMIVVVSLVSACPTDGPCGGCSAISGIGVTVCGVSMATLGGGSARSLGTGAVWRATLGCDSGMGPSRP